MGKFQVSGKLEQYCRFPFFFRVIGQILRKKCDDMIRNSEVWAGPISVSVCEDYRMGARVTSYITVDLSVYNRTTV